MNKKFFLRVLIQRVHMKKNRIVNHFALWKLTCTCPNCLKTKLQYLCEKIHSKRLF